MLITNLFIDMINIFLNHDCYCVDGGTYSVYTGLLSAAGDSLPYYS
jgi:hypothetical protein